MTGLEATRGTGRSALKRYFLNMNKTIGAGLLVGGCCIGVGMVGMPVMTGASGFFPALMMLFIAWGFMGLSGWVLTRLVVTSRKEGVNLLSLTEASFGRVGRTVVWVLFSVLFYAVMVAYIIGGASLFGDACELFFGGKLPFLGNAFLFTACLYAVVARGVGHVDLWNRALMVGLAVCYVLLVCFGLPQVHYANLMQASWSQAWVALPILILSFGYHNLVPTLARYLDYDMPKLKRAIIGGSLIPLAIYILWEVVILGLIPPNAGELWARAQSHGDMVNQLLVEAVESNRIVHVTQGFSFFAIVTSFLPVACSFVDFLADAFAPRTLPSRRLLTLIVLLPPFLIAVGDPRLFLGALNFAGGTCAVLLFGLLPALMMWKRQRADGRTMVPRGVLLFLIVGSLVLATVQLFQDMTRG